MANKANITAGFLLVIIIGGVALLIMDNENGGNGGNPSPTNTIIANHLISNWTLYGKIPESAIQTAKNTLNISYGHTSHGRHITDGMSDLVSFMNGKGATTGLYQWFDGVDASTATLNLDDYGMDGDLGNPDRTTWATRTRTYLNSHPYCNVIMWSWCGQVGGTEEEIANDYLANMNQLEQDYPSVKFVYMTGHVDGNGLTGSVHLRNEQIRAYCNENDKILFDFADIESYDPDGNYFGDKNVNDECDYDCGGSTCNWATDWQVSHTENVDWYTCTSAHSQPLNANLKAYAAWWMFARIAGWDGTPV